MPLWTSNANLTHLVFVYTVDMIKDMDPVEAFLFGYSVGIYEGEGTLNTWQLNPNRRYAKLVVRMTDEEPVRILQQVLGGVAKGPYLSPGERAKGYKVKYRWTVSQIDEVLRITAAMRPYLSARRREQFDKGLATVVPNMRRTVAAGNRRDGTKLPLKPRKTGQLVCPASPEPSVRGYRRHKLLGIPVCDVCLASWKLYYAAKRKWDKAAMEHWTPEQTEAWRIRSRAYTAKWQAKQKAKRLAALESAVQVDS